MADNKGNDDAEIIELIRQDAERTGLPAENGRTNDEFLEGLVIRAIAGASAITRKFWYTLRYEPKSERAS